MLEEERQQFKFQFRAYQFLAIKGDGLRVKVEHDALITNLTISANNGLLGL